MRHHEAVQEHERPSAPRIRPMDEHPTGAGFNEGSGEAHDAPIFITSGAAA
jgi:hypothetical protein